MILVQDCEYILRYLTYINEYQFKVCKRDNIMKLKKEYDMYFFMINDEIDLNNLNYINGKVLIFIKDVDIKILWRISRICNCLDVININNNTESILERIKSNIKKGECNEKIDNNN